MIKKAKLRMLTILMAISMAAAPVVAASEPIVAYAGETAQDVADKLIAMYNEVGDALDSSVQAEMVVDIDSVGQSSLDDEHPVKVEIDGITYYLKTKDAKDITNTYGKRIDSYYDEAQTSVSDTTSKVDEIDIGFDISADTENAGMALSGAREFISTAVGIMLYIVVLATAFFTATDIMYITMPVFRGKCDDAAAAHSSNAMMTNTSKSTGQSKLRLITDEAVYAVKVCGVDTGRNPLTVYLAKRGVAYALVAVAVYLLASGNVSIITNLALKILSGVISVVEKLGS